MKQGKVWGETTLIFSSGHVSVHFLEIKKGGFCSRHRHSRKTNLFHIISGQLEICQWETPRSEPDITMLLSGESLFIPITLWHRFRALEDTHCIEICEAMSIDEDIERESAGGVVP